MIRHVIPKGAHQLQLTEVVNWQFHRSNNHRSLRCGADASPEASHALVFVYLPEAANQSHMIRSLAMHLHANLKHIRGICNGRGNSSCSSGTNDIAPNPLTAILVCQQSTLVSQLLESVVSAELNGAIGRLSQHRGPNAARQERLLSVIIIIGNKV